MANAPELAILYYDGACPLCRREIALVRRLTRQVDFVDVHGLADEELPSGLNRLAMLRDLHLRRTDGRLEVGLDANIALWQATPLGWLWRILNLPGIRPLAQWGYRRWADRRYDRMGYCAVQRENRDEGTSA